MTKQKEAQARIMEIKLQDKASYVAFLLRDVILSLFSISVFISYVQKHVPLLDATHNLVGMRKREKLWSLVV